MRAYHNLDLANKVFDMHGGEAAFRYESENYFDWVITICYYAMYLKVALDNHAVLVSLDKEEFIDKVNFKRPNIEAYQVSKFPY
jgi:hypothetical protein